MKYLELTIPGRPVPWARARRARSGQSFTPEKQAGHRKDVAFELRVEVKASEFGTLRGPLYLQALFVYGKEPGTWLRLVEMEETANLDLIMPFDLGEEFHVGRPDLDNLVKQIMEAIEDSGLLTGEDSQISMVTAAKVKR